VRVVGAATLLAALVVLLAGSPALAAGASTADAARSAAQLATGQGYRTGIAVLNLRTGSYAGAGDDTATFPSESVVKVMIAARLLLTGQMTGDVQTEAYQMITQSDDDDADALYGLAGGDDLVPDLAAHYGITDLGGPPSEEGWWGNTPVTAKGMVQLYAALAKDSAVGPWLIDAMSHATQYGADGTDQLFGLPAATSGAAFKQGWGDDGDDSTDAVFNSTGYVGGATYAVAILTDGPADSYGSAISDVVTAEAKALMPGGTIAGSAPVTSAPATGAPAATAPVAAGQTNAPLAAGEQVQTLPTQSATGRLRHSLGLVGVDLAGAATLGAVVVLPWRRRQRTARHARLH
jgi:hypothetical protein